MDDINYIQVMKDLNDKRIKSDDSNVHDLARHCPDFVAACTVWVPWAIEQLENLTNSDRLLNETSFKLMAATDEIENLKEKYELAMKRNEKLETIVFCLNRLIGVGAFVNNETSTVLIKSLLEYINEGI